MSMQNYELAYLISADISEDEIKDTQEKINSLLQENGGLLTYSSLARKKVLAYPIKKKWNGLFAFLNFQIEANKLPIFERKTKSLENILRCLISARKTLKDAKRRHVRIFKKKEEESKPKAELKEIEKKIEEILGE